MFPVRLALASVFLLIGCDTYGLDAPPTADADATAWPEMLEAVNAARAEGAVCGATRMPPVGPVVWNDRLHEAAAQHVTDMERRAFFSHEGSDGSRVGDRARRAGYAWRMIGENIARYQDSVDEVMADWMESEGHCRQVMDPRFVEMGAAERATYWAQVFGISR
jgi:uncharacterized protein YkwD